MKSLPILVAFSVIAAKGSPATNGSMLEKIYPQEYPTPEPCPEVTCTTEYYPVHEVCSCQTCQECEVPPTTPWPFDCPAITCESQECSTTSPTEPPTTNLQQTHPKFTKTYFTVFLPNWPTSGTQIHSGIAASTETGDKIAFSLIDPPSFIHLLTSKNLIFTSDIAEGAFVGPNNVMILEVEASVYGNSHRSTRSVILVVFPRSKSLLDKK